MYITGDRGGGQIDPPLGIGRLKKVGLNRVKTRRTSGDVSAASRTLRFTNVMIHPLTSLESKLLVT